MTTIRTEYIAAEENFFKLRDAWNRLAEDTDPTSVFLRHEWFDAAWQWLRASAELCVLAIYDGGQLIGIWPLVVKQSKHRGIRIRSIEFLCVPDTQECDVLSASGERERVLDHGVAFLISGKIEWDTLTLDKLCVDRATYTRLPDILSRVHRLACRSDLSGDNFGIRLDGTWKGFYAGRTRRLKKGNNHIRNRIERAGMSIEIEWQKPSSLAEANRHRLLDIITEISSESWKQETSLTLDQEDPQRFVSRLIEHAASEGWLSIWLLKFDGRPVAQELQLVYRGQVAALRADYRASSRDYSPGAYLNWQLIEQLFESSESNYWMGPGSNEYKLRWSDTQTALGRVTVFASSLRGMACRLLELALLPALRRLRVGARLLLGTPANLKK